MSQYVRDLADDTPRPVETTGGRHGWSVSSAAQLSAFKSCARQIGVDVELVLRAASTNKLGALIESRKGSARSVESRNVARLAHLYRQRTLGILLERDAMLRSRV